MFRPWRRLYRLRSLCHDGSTKGEGEGPNNTEYLSHISLFRVFSIFLLTALNIIVLHQTKLAPSKAPAIGRPI